MLYFNDLFKQMGINQTVTYEQTLEAVRSMDQNSDGTLDKDELFLAFMKLMSTVPPPQMTQSYPQPSYPPSNGPYGNGGMTVSYPQPHQYPPPSSNPWYNYSPCDDYGMPNPYMQNAHYPPQYPPHTPPNYGQNYPQYPPSNYHPHYPQPGYQPPNMGGYQQQPPPYNPYSKGNFGGNPGGKRK
jgi:hypothetical protein